MNSKNKRIILISLVLIAVLIILSLFRLTFAKEDGYFFSFQNETTQSGDVTMTNFEKYAIIESQGTQVTTLDP